MLWLGNLDTGLKVKENLLCTEMNFWRRAARTYRLLEAGNALKKMAVKQFWKMENNMLKLYGHVVCVGGRLTAEANNDLVRVGS